MQEQNKELSRKAIEDIWNKHNPEAVDLYYDSDFVNYTPQPGFTPDRQGLKQWVAALSQAFPDGRLTFEEQVAEGDKVVNCWTYEGTHRAEFMGIPATGKKVVLTGIHVLRFVNGKAKDSREGWDKLTLLQQLGVVPPPQPAK